MYPFRYSIYILNAKIQNS